MANDRSTTELTAAVGQGREPVSTAASEVLLDPHCRYVPRYLHEHPTARVEEPVDVVFGAEVAECDTIATPATRDPICFSLRNTVLPKLGDLGYVEYDPDYRTITRGAVPEELESALCIDE